MTDKIVNLKDAVITANGAVLDPSGYGDESHFTIAAPLAPGFRVGGIGEAEQDNLHRHDALTLATARLQAWQDWTARILTPEVQEETDSLSTLIAETDRDPHVPYRAAVLGAFATMQAEVAAVKQAADSLEKLARHYKAEVDILRRAAVEDKAIIDNERERFDALSQGSKVTFDRYRGAIEAMLLASEHTDPRESIIEAAAKVGAYLDCGTQDLADLRVRWRLDDRKDGDA